MTYMFGNVLATSTLYTLQKVLLQYNLERNNPIDPNEWMYWICLTVCILNIFASWYTNANLFPIPKNLRVIFIVRMFSGMLSNITFLISLKFIPFAKASVIFWTSPVFTALGASIFLKEKLTKFDWVALVIAFICIIVI